MDTASTSDRHRGLVLIFSIALFADINSLVLYAGIHSKPDGRFCRTLAKRFPYAVYYRIEGELVTVVAILDCRRNLIRIRIDELSKKTIVVP